MLELAPPPTHTFTSLPLSLRDAAEHTYTLAPAPPRRFSLRTSMTGFHTRPRGAGSLSGASEGRDLASTPLLCIAPHQQRHITPRGASPPSAAPSPSLAGRQPAGREKDTVFSGAPRLAGFMEGLAYVYSSPSSWFI